MNSLVVTAVRFLAGWLWSLAVAMVFCGLCPLVGPRRVWRWLRTPWARVSLRLVGVRLNVIGREHLVEPAVYIANHESLMDVVIVPAVVPPYTLFVAKRSISRIPFWGWAFAAGGAIFIDRSNPRLAYEKLQAAGQQLPKAWSLAIFPEGTRSRNGELGRFKQGAFVLARAGNRPVVPIALVGARETTGRNGWFVRGGTVTVLIGQALDVDSYATMPLREHMAAGQAAVSDLIAVARKAHGA